MKSLRMAAIGALCTMSFIGCGNGMLQPKGRVVKAGAPMALKDGEDLGIFFYPLTDEGKLGLTVYPAYFQAADSSFRVTGNDRRGLPPGKYRVAVELKLNKKDQFKGAYDMNNSPFVFEVNSNTGEILIDLSKKS